jgi:hypothetical protein
MEQLAKTCKVLYDKEFIDNQKLFKDGYSYNKILYESKQEFDCLCQEFKDGLSNLIKSNNIDDWTYIDWQSPNNFGLQYSCPCEEVLGEALSKLTKNQNKKWVENMSDILGCAIRGIAKSISLMNSFNEETECDECGNERIEINFQEKFENRNICNIMITNMINNILFDEEKIGDGGGCALGQMDKIKQFKCEKCNKFCEFIDNWDDEFECEICVDCSV